MELDEMTFAQLVDKCVSDDMSAIAAGISAKMRVKHTARLAVKWRVKTANKSAELLVTSLYVEQSVSESAQPPADVAARWDGRPGNAGVRAWHLVQSAALRAPASAPARSRVKVQWDPVVEKWNLDGCFINQADAALWWTYIGPQSDQSDAAAQPEAGRHVTLATEHYFDGQRIEAGRYRMVKIDGEADDTRF